MFCIADILRAIKHCYAAVLGYEVGLFVILNQANINF